MRKFLYLFFLFFFTHALAEVEDINSSNYFYIGKMESYDKDFTLYFKTRGKAVLARGENYNYITDYPQDLYIYDHKTKKDFPLISYEWFPRKAKTILRSYDFPVFPEDFAYYLLSDNNTLIMISAMKNINKNLQFDIKKKKIKSLRQQRKNGFYYFYLCKKMWI